MNFFTGILLGTALFTTSAHADNKWNKANDPSNFEKDYVYNFSTLPTGGGIDETHKGWSDSYWPATRGSILDRWQQPAMAFKYNDYVFPTQAQVMAMTEAQINLLSPAEKFDIIRGRFDYPLSTALKAIKTTKEDWWRGSCDGWTASSLTFDEPIAIRYYSRALNKFIPFASSDIKGLLAYYYAKVADFPSQAVGLACKAYSGLEFNAACKDVNAASFHVLVANEMGLRQHGVAMDRDPGIQTWNQPFTSFQTEIVSSGPPSKHHSNGTASEVTVKTTLTYVNELYNTEVESLEDDVHSDPQVNALGIGNQRTHNITYNYTLELDANGNIIGGEWIGDDHPDVIWRDQIDPSKIGQTFSGQPDGWEILSNLVAQSTFYAKPLQGAKISDSVRGLLTDKFAPASDSISSILMPNLLPSEFSEPVLPNVVPEPTAAPVAPTATPAQ